MTTHIHCPFCKNNHTIRKGVRRGKLKYVCKDCCKWFQINRTSPSIKVDQLVRFHLNGISFRTLSREFDCSVGTCYNKVNDYLCSLPHCADVTREFCARFCGVLLVDGKYVKVKGYRREIPVIYGIDYQTHDIPTYSLVRGENYLACKRFFESVKLSGYPLTSIVSDDNKNIRDAATYIFPNTVAQLCLNHYQQSVKNTLDLECNQTHREFYRSFKTLFTFKRAEADFNRRAKGILGDFKADPVCVAVMVECYRKLPLLRGWSQGKRIPTTTNLIESFNSHLEGRLRSIKGFESYAHANTWLNAYFLNRRQKKFTDCEGKFKRLNGKTSLSQTQKSGIDVPDYFH